MSFLNRKRARRRNKQCKHYICCRFDMAELLMRLKQYDKAEKCIAQALEAENQAPAADALQSLMSQAKFFGLLAQVHERSGNSFMQSLKLMILP